MNAASNLSIHALHVCTMGLYSGEYGGKKIEICQYFFAI